MPISLDNVNHVNYYAYSGCVAIDRGMIVGQNKRGIVVYPALGNNCGLDITNKYYELLCVKRLLASNGPNSGGV